MGHGHTAVLLDKLRLASVIDPLQSAPALYNDPTLVNQLVAALGRGLGEANVVPAEPVMGSEDFAAFGPGCGRAFGNDLVGRRPDHGRTAARRPLRAFCARPRANPPHWCDGADSRGARVARHVALTRAQPVLRHLGSSTEAPARCADCRDEKSSRGRGIISAIAAKPGHVRCSIGNTIYQVPSKPAKCY